MASTKIYVCDKCENYVEEQALHRVGITIQGGSHYNSGKAAILTGSGNYSSPIWRDICRTCAELLIEDFSLDKSDKILNTELSSNLRLQKPVT